MTRKIYANVRLDDFVTLNAASPAYEKHEREKLKKILIRLKSIGFNPKVIVELGAGYGRHYDLLHTIFSNAKIILIEQSQSNIDIAVNEMKVPKECCRC